jgi:hypothetical protein
MSEICDACRTSQGLVYTLFSMVRYKALQVVVSFNVASTPMQRPLSSAL